MPGSIDENGGECRTASVRMAGNGGSSAYNGVWI